MPNKELVLDVTLCITMGGRPDLLRASLLSISDKYIFPRVVAINDFADVRCDEVFLEIFPDGELISDGVKRGHHGAIKKLYENVKTKFVLHTEDDWVFNKSINFSIIKKLLAENRGITSYCFRSVFDFLKAEELLKINKKECTGVSFFDLSEVHPEWYFYTFNPHLILLENINLVGDYKKYKKERHISRFFKKNKKFVAYADPGICVHIGEGVSVANPNAGKKKSRLRIWIREKINKLKLAFDNQS